MEELRGRMDELAALMDEYRLGEAELRGEDWKVLFRRNPSVPPSAEQADGQAAASHHEPAAIELQKGTPVSSPMSGIFYSSPSPSTPPFAREGDSVEAGQVVGLIEAMKVFNEITAPVSGVVLRMVAQNGQLVQPGEPLLFIG
ncbi:MAG: acetyl-CoA carboxylase biotin carboxyl carrier protein subunit [Fimbriimonas ginsengisoli]|uniref:Biotin carboxyl carrier protein of acetyl-CoA carboxylase n=1 Tax=Fimbriimonas ginsengisoli TaxID=1005039 RepID=A0A931LR41_FIMGI|nr:acetyl-CoA carboxylase biotin carboxyl carrier protein subunit [Fimbriimonas ginsengisoli]